jgi:hypothetical protein
MCEVLVIQHVDSSRQSSSPCLHTQVYIHNSTKTNAIAKKQLNTPALHHFM